MKKARNWAEYLPRFGRRFGYLFGPCLGLVCGGRVYVYRPLFVFGVWSFVVFDYLCRVQSIKHHTIMVNSMPLFIAGALAFFIVCAALSYIQTKAQNK